MPVRYAYLGPEGTFTEAALAEFDPSALAEAMPCASIPAALDAVRGGTAERAIVPIESSVEGAVTATLDELAAGPDLAIQAELLLPVTFALLGREGTILADIKTVGGHPQAQPQCRRWLAQHLPDAEWLPTSSNAEAARQAADVRFLGSYPRRDGGRTQVRTGTSDTEFAQAAAWLGRLRYGRV
jgi:prephenate dehydratase